MKTVLIIAFAAIIATAIGMGFGFPGDEVFDGTLALGVGVFSATVIGTVVYLMFGADR